MSDMRKVPKLKNGGALRPRRGALIIYERYDRNPIYRAKINISKWFIRLEHRVVTAVHNLKGSNVNRTPWPRS